MLSSGQKKSCHGILELGSRQCLGHWRDSQWNWLFAGWTPSRTRNSYAVPEILLSKLPLVALIRHERSTNEAQPSSHCRSYRSSLLSNAYGMHICHDTDAGCILPVSSFTSRMISLSTPCHLKPLADCFSTLAWLKTPVSTTLTSLRPR